MLTRTSSPFILSTLPCLGRRIAFRVRLVYDIFFPTQITDRSLPNFAKLTFNRQQQLVEGTLDRHSMAPTVVMSRGVTTG
jgi:hypothetical protein